jgi:hypothetical protein
VDEKVSPNPRWSLHRTSSVKDHGEGGLTGGHINLVVNTGVGVADHLNGQRREHNPAVRSWVTHVVAALGGRYRGDAQHRDGAFKTRQSSAHTGVGELPR